MLFSAVQSIAFLATIELNDIREPLPVPNPWVPFLIGAALLLAAILAYVVFLWIRAIRCGPPPKIPTAWERALEAIRESISHIEKGDHENFVIFSSLTLRTYIENQFRIHAPEMTTEEFLPQAARHRVLMGTPSQRLAAFLQQCDLVKYANQSMQREEMLNLRQNALDFLQECRTREEQLLAQDQQDAPTEHPPKPRPATARA